MGPLSERIAYSSSKFAFETPVLGVIKHAIDVPRALHDRPDKPKVTCLCEKALFNCIPKDTTILL